MSLIRFKVRGNSVGAVSPGRSALGGLFLAELWSLKMRETRFDGLVGAAAGAGTLPEVVGRRGRRTLDSPLLGGSEAVDKEDSSGGET